MNSLIDQMLANENTSTLITAKKITICYKGSTVNFLLAMKNFIQPWAYLSEQYLGPV
jgi:hypothetical protein